MSDSPKDYSLDDLPLLENVDDVDIVVLMFDFDMLAYISFNLAHVFAIWTLEPGLLAALIAKVARQVSLPREATPAIRIRAQELHRLFPPVQSLRAGVDHPACRPLVT